MSVTDTQWLPISTHEISYGGCSHKRFEHAGNGSKCGERVITFVLPSAFGRAPIELAGRMSADRRHRTLAFRALTDCGFGFSFWIEARWRDFDISHVLVSLDPNKSYACKPLTRVHSFPSKTRPVLVKAQFQTAKPTSSFKRTSFEFLLKSSEDGGAPLQVQCCHVLWRLLRRRRTGSEEAGRYVP